MESISKLEKDYNSQVIRYTKQQLELKDEKGENEALRLEVQKQREFMRQQAHDIAELRAALKDREGFQNLEGAVSQLISVVVSKKNEQLSVSQRE